MKGCFSSRMSTICLVIFAVLSCSPVKAEVYKWGLWDTWSTCSESCGKGVETRERSCLKTGSAPQASKTRVNTRSCTGNSLEFRFCYVKDCDDGQFVRPKVTYIDAYRIRAQQCIEFNKKSYNGKNIKWKPYLRDNLDQCKLYCLAAGHKFYARLKNAVNDGTPCGKDFSNVCIKGKCQKRPRGCDTIDGPCLVGEKRKVLGVFNSTKFSLGYNLVATIPTGATNITIEELKNSRSYLALKDHNSGIYRLNGHWMISLSKTFQLGNSRVKYIRSGNTRRGGEMITIDGPLEKSLDIMVVYQREPSVIMYSYSVPDDEYKKLERQPRTEGQNLYFPERRRSPGPNEDLQNDMPAAQSSDAEGESISFIAGESRASSPNNDQPGGQGFTYPHLSKNLRQAVGNDQGQSGKQVSWYGSSWVQFGGDQTGQQKGRTVPGTQPARRPFLNQQVYKPNQFRNSQLARTQHQEQARGRFDNSKRTFPWASRTGSSQFGRPVVPENQAPRWQGLNSKKQFYTSGQEQDGGAYVWRIVGLTQCSASCAGGVQSGIVKCVHVTTGGNAEDTKCAFQTRPQETRRVCNLEPCPARWDPQEWQACSKTCGEGQQGRDLMCKQTIDQNGEKVTVMLPVVKCPVHLRPEVIQKCFVRECPELERPKWAVEDWGECSVECGHGVQKRNIACKNNKNETVEDSECLWMKKPIVLKSCYLGLCKADWYFRPEWSQCSRTCESGLRGRPVICTRIGGSKVAEEYCKDKTKPEHEQNCNTQRCKGIWFASEWSKCSTNCGKGLQQRIAICMKSVDGTYHETFDADCALADKPAVRKDCDIDCAPTWFISPWSQCSVSCGNGVQTRHASCLNSEGKRVGGCKAWERPQQRRTCHPKACPGKVPAKTSTASTCKDNPPRSFKRYCHIIKRINYCRIPSYRNRCCETCSRESQTLGHM